jgi:hypothetical protein
MLALADSTCWDRDAGTRCPAVLFAVTNDDVPFQNSKPFQYVERSVPLSLEWNLWAFDVLANIRSATLWRARNCRIARHPPAINGKACMNLPTSRKQTFAESTFFDRKLKNCHQ